MSWHKNQYANTPGTGKKNKASLIILMLFYNNPSCFVPQMQNAVEIKFLYSV